MPIGVGAPCQVTSPIWEGAHNAPNVDYGQISRLSDRACNGPGWEHALITLRIHHGTIYRYAQPVSFGPHRLMLRPRESRDLRLISSKVTVAPAAGVSWAQDVFGNSVAIATFHTMADHLSIDSVAELELKAVAWPVFDIAAAAIFFPFQYSDEEWTDLGALTIQQYPDPAGRLRDWARAFVRGNPTNTLALLKDPAPAFRHGSIIRVGTTRGPNRRPKLWSAAGDPAGISRSFSSKRRAASDSGRG
jgi:hypothetical protein